MSRAARSTILRYGFALLTVALALLLSLLLRLMGASSVALLFIPAVMLSTWYCGMKPGLLTTVISVLAIDYFLLPSPYPSSYGLKLSWEYLPRLAVFTFVALLTSSLTVARKRAEAALRTAHDELERRVVERTAELSTANAILGEQINERQRAEEKVRKLLDEVLKLYHLSRDIIATLDPESAISSLANHVVAVFGFNYCAIFASDENNQWQRLSTAAGLSGEDSYDFSPITLKEALLTAEMKSSHDAAEELPPHPEPALTYLPLKTGHKAIGVMALTPAALEPETLEAIAGLVAMAFERASFLRKLSHTEALKRSDELKSALLASVSHDLRTPLTSIRASLDSLLNQELHWDQAALHEFHLIINEEVNRLARLVENLLDMARIEAGELRLSKQWSSVAEICRNVLDRHAALLHQRQVRVECAEDLPAVRIDSRLVAQALASLVENAAKYSPSGSEILVQAKLQDHDLVMSVTDSGPGIELEETERIFDKFYRGRHPREQQSSGTGMGLAIARGIIQAHGGRIWVENAPSQGATFAFLLSVEYKEAEELKAVGAELS